MSRPENVYAYDTASVDGPSRCFKPQIPIVRRPRDVQRSADIVDFNRAVAARVSGQQDFPCVRAKRGTTALPATSPGSGESRFCPLLNEATLELGKSREDVEDEFAGRARRVNDALSQGPETNSAIPKAFDQVHQVPHRTSQPIESPDNQSIAAAERLETFRQSRSIALGPGKLISEDERLRNTMPLKSVEL